MGNPRYTIDEEKVDKWLIEEVVDTALDIDREPVKVIITDEQTGQSESAVGSDYDEALERACHKMGISADDLDQEIEDD